LVEKSRNYMIIHWLIAATFLHSIFIRTMCLNQLHSGRHIWLKSTFLVLITDYHNKYIMVKQFKIIILISTKFDEWCRFPCHFHCKVHLFVIRLALIKKKLTKLEYKLNKLNLLFDITFGSVWYKTYTKQHFYTV